MTGASPAYSIGVTGTAGRLRRRLGGSEVLDLDRRQIDHGRNRNHRLVGPGERRLALGCAGSAHRAGDRPAGLFGSGRGIAGAGRRRGRRSRRAGGMIVAGALASAGWLGSRASPARRAAGAAGEGGTTRRRSAGLAGRLQRGRPLRRARHEARRRPARSSSRVDAGDARRGRPALQDDPVDEGAAARVEDQADAAAIDADAVDHLRAAGADGAVDADQAESRARRCA